MTRRLSLNVALGALSWLLAGTVRAGDAITALPPQTLATALESIARQAGLQLIYSSFLSNGVETVGSPEGLSWQDALREVLKGTGLTFQLVNSHTVTIVPDPEVQPDAVFTHAESASRLTHHRTEPVELSLDFSMEQVVITGSHISGVAPVGGQVIVITRKEIDRSGFSTVHDVIRTLPQNFGGGPSEDTHTGLDDQFNSSRATGLNLRALGAGSTLILLNGRRLAASGSDGRFVDITGIPLSAVERVEILPDGASAIYGADAVGGVVNFILRDDYDGAESQLKFGSVTHGSLRETQTAQSLGRHWDTGNLLLSLEYLQRDALPNSARSQSADSDLTSFGGTDFSTRESNPGTIIGPTGFFAIPANQNGSSLQPADFTPGTQNLYNLNEGWDLLPENKRLSAVGTLRQNVGDHVELFWDTLLSERHTNFLNPAIRQTITVPESNPFYVNPTGLPGPVSVAYNFASDFGAQRDIGKVTTANVAFGGSVKAGDTWEITSYGNYSLAREVSVAGRTVNQLALAAALADPDPATAFNPFGDGSFTNPTTLAAISEDIYGRRVADLSTITVTANGSLLDLANRDVRIALGADRRWQTLKTFFTQGEAVLTDREVGRQVMSAYAELLIPLTPTHANEREPNGAKLSLAARHEHYSDFGSSTTPKIGVRWTLLERLTLRSSWARSLKAPSLADLDESRNAIAQTLLPDPSSAAGFSPVLLWVGGNTDLHEEEATTWTAGLEYAIPERQTSFSLGYFDITFRDRIDQIPFNLSVLSDPMYADRITRNPSVELRQDVCARGIVLGSADSCASDPVAAVVDLRFNNTAVMKTSGVDLLANHELPTRFGTFTSRINATYLVNFSRAQFRNSPLLSLLDTPNNPLQMRMRSSVSWDRQGMGVTAFLNYAGGYRDLVSEPERDVGSWTTLDLQARYGATTLDPRRLDGASFSLSVQNIFNTNPPFFNNPEGIGYDSSNADLLGRFVSFQVRKAW